MVYRGPFGVPTRRVVLLIAAVAAVLSSLLVPAIASAQGGKRVLLYTGTTGFRHTDGINGGRPIVQTAIETAGYTVDWEDCNLNNGETGACNHADKNPRIFSDANLAKYDAIVLLNSSSNGVLWNDPQKAAIIKYVQNGGGIAGVHNATDMGTSQESWNWWDGDNGNSVIGARMKGHGVTSLNNVGQIQVADQNHLSTRELPDQYGFGDEHYNFTRSVRGTHHVLATIDERTYNPGNPMGQDHPVTWCKLYDGDNVNDNTGTPKSYADGRTWVTSMGHFGAQYTENGGNNNLVKQIVGGVRWVAGEGKKSDCSGTVWSSFTREVVVGNANNPIGIDVAKDGKVYWSEIGNPAALVSTGYIKMHDPAKPAGNNTTVASIPTRADHGNSEDGVLGMSLQPGFDLADANKRHVFVYYSPRNAAWPTTGSAQVVGYNQISRFTLNAEGTAVVTGSERVILRVPKVKIAGSPSGFPDGPGDSGPGHVGGAGLDFDSAGNLYLGVGDDVSPNANGHNGYAPMDYRAAERWDARKTSQNSADLRGKIVRITPKLDAIPADAEPALNATYTVPAGNMFPVGTAKTRPEIYAMGFRQPFTVHTDPANPGVVATGEYCHDNNTDLAGRSPAGICEWNLLNKAGNHGWPFCMGDNSPASSTFRWNYANQTTTGQQYDCSLTNLPSDIRYAPQGQTPVQPTFDGLDTLPGPVERATIFKRGSTGVTPDFGDLSAGGLQPITGPIYRSDATNTSQGAFPAYYDGSWLINNRNSDNGFWKEVQLRKDNNQMLRVNEWLPYNGGVRNGGDAANSSLVIGTQFGPDGNLYMARYSVGCCRNQNNANQQTQIVKISFNVLDRCDTDTNAPNTSADVTGQAYPDRANTYVNSARLRLSATDSGCAGVKNLEYRQAGSTEWLPYTSEVTFDEGKTYNIEYRATDRKDNVAAVKTATFEILKINDTTAPATSAATSGTKDQREYFVGTATLTVTATDTEAGASGVQTVEYRSNGGAWTAYTAPVAFNTAGNYTVDYRATDKVNNTSAVKSVTFRVLAGAGCTLPRSDEFNGTTLGSQWTRYERNGGTPASAITFADGKLRMPTADFELDSNNLQTSVGPVNFIGQDLPALGNNWQVETEFTVKYTGGWQNTGLIIWTGDNNFVRSSITHSRDAGNIYVEQSRDNPSTNPEGSRQQAGSNITIAPNKNDPITIRMRYTRTNGSDTVVPQYRVMAPAAMAMPDWANFGGAADFVNLSPAANVRRDGTGSRIGIITQSNFPGSPGAHAYPGTPGTVDVNYFRVTPDPVTCETDKPTTTHTLDPAAPATGDTYDRAVKVTLAATDAGANASGLDKTEYRVNTNGTAGEWKTYTDAGITVSSSGTHVVEYRSTDKAANTEDTKSVTFKVQLPVCERSDEFDGSELRGHWLRHTRNGGTPLTGALAPTLSNGVLKLPTNNLELDGNSAVTAVGPVNFIGQDLAALGNAWTAETQFTVQFTGGWQHVGLIVHNGDNNFFRSTITHDLNAGTFYVEQSKDNPSSTEGARSQAGGNVVILPNKSQPVTIRMRYTRASGANTVQAQYRVIAPANVASPDWVNFPGAASFLDLNPTSGARRDAAGSRIGIIAAGNFGGQGGTTTPAVADVEYFRVTPDVCPDPVAPVTTATLDPAAPGAGGTYTEPVTLTLNATDQGSGVDKTEYQVTTSSPFGGFGQAKLIKGSEEAWVLYDPANKPRFTEAGNYSIEFRSTDKAGNVEAIKTIAFTIAARPSDDTAAPVSTATLAPAAPGAGGTYEEPVTVTFAATDPAQQAPGGANVDNQPAGLEWLKKAIEIKNGDKITWNWPVDEATGHDLRLRAPGTPTAPNQAEATKQLEVLKQIAFAGDTPASKTFTQNGVWEFICTLHSTYSSQTNTWTGMVGTATVTGAAPVAPTTSGVDYTEYRVDGGTWTKGTSVTVSAVGSHTVEFRSADKAGNLETAKSVAFSIKEKTVTPGATPTPVPPAATPVPPAATPNPGATPGPKPKPSFKVATPAKTTVAKFAKSGLKFRAMCTEAMSGRATVTVTSKVRKQLKLKSATLAKVNVRCAAGTKTVTIKPSASMKRALAKVKQSVKVKVTVTLKPAGQPALKATLNVTLARK